MSNLEKEIKENTRMFEELGTYLLGYIEGKSEVDRFRCLTGITAQLSKIENRMDYLVEELNKGGN